MLPIRNISYLSLMCCNFWEKCINSHWIGQGCSNPLTLRFLNHSLSIHLILSIFFFFTFLSLFSFETNKVLQKVEGDSSPPQPRCSTCMVYMCRTTVIFITLKDGSLQINSLASNNCFSYINVFQNDANALSKMINHFLSKVQNFV